MKIQADLSLARGNFILHTAFDSTLTGITALFGPSGSGKTTLLRCIAGLERAAGSLMLGGELWQNHTTFLATHQRRVGYIFQEADLFPHLNVEQNLRFGYRRLPQSSRRFEPQLITELLAIGHLLPRSIAGLSGGERQLVALGRALLSSPAFLMMDEPLAALDQGVKQTLFPFLRRIAVELKIPIIYVSHALDEVARLADQLMLIAGGKILATGPVGAMLTRLDLPLARSSDAESLIEGSIVGQKADFHLTRVGFSGGEFLIPHIDLPAGAAVRLRIVASDVSLTLTRHNDSSILNVFPARVTEIVPEPPALLLVKLDLAGTAVLARLTRMSCETLGIAVGSQVFAQIKSTAALV